MFLVSDGRWAKSPAGGQQHCRITVKELFCWRSTCLHWCYFHRRTVLWPHYEAHTTRDQGPIDDGWDKNDVITKQLAVHSFVRLCVSGSLSNFCAILWSVCAWILVLHKNFILLSFASWIDRASEVKVKFQVYLRSLVRFFAATSVLTV